LQAGRPAGARDEHPVGAHPEAAGGDEVTLEADGDGAEQALDQLVALLAQDLDA
jgi:hypothetical protein